MADSEDRVGQQLGNYRLVKVLGKGGFAEVYLGQHIHLASKQAAIKILHLTDVDARKFQEEAETTEKLVHPHIVRLLDFDIQQGTPFLVLDYAPGGSLRTRHPKGSCLSLDLVEAYLKELAPALQYAHDQHVLHRDIKPDNMLIGRGGELLLSDFGIAVLTQTGRNSFSSAYGIGGTPYYMAPETYRGRPARASDQYALAAVVYEWLCGSVPYSEGGFIQLGYQHAHEPVPSLRERNPAIPPKVEAVIMKALAKDPKERFARISEFALALEDAWKAAPPQPPQVISVPPSQGQRLQTKVIPQAELQSVAPIPQIVNAYNPQQGKGEAIAAALEQLEAGRYIEALSTLENILRSDPTFQQALNCKGLALYRLKRYPEALTALNNAIVQNANDASAYYGKVLTLEKMQRYLEALEALEQVTKLYPTYVAAWCKKGDLLSHLKRYEASLTAYEQALKLDPNNADAYIGKGSALKLLGRAK